MIPTWYFSSSKCSSDISQLNVTVPCPVSGCPLEREPLGHPRVGVRASIPAPPAAGFHLGSAFTFPALGPLSSAVWREACISPWLRNHFAAFSSVRDATRWMSSVLRCNFFFFHIWTSLKSVCILQVMKGHSSVGSVSFSLTHIIMMWHTIAVTCQPLLKHGIATHSRTYSFVAYFLLMFLEESFLPYSHHNSNIWSLYCAENANN